LNDKIADLIVSETNRKDLRAVFRFDDVLRKIRLNVSGSEGEVFYMSERFKDFFGCKNVGPYPNGVYDAENTFNVNDISHLMYVYCDIASFTPVGHVIAPLLRVCSVSGKYGDTVRTIFTHPQYVPVARREIETVEININNELGKPMPFVFGKSVVTLHFRRRQSLVFIMKKPYCCEASKHMFDQYYSRQQKGGGDFPVHVGRYFVEYYPT